MYNLLLVFENDASFSIVQSSVGDIKWPDTNILSYANLMSSLVYQVSLWKNLDLNATYRPSFNESSGRRDQQLPLLHYVHYIYILLNQRLQIPLNSFTENEFGSHFPTYLAQQKLSYLVINGCNNNIVSKVNMPQLC